MKRTYYFFLLLAVAVFSNSCGTFNIRKHYFNTTSETSVSDIAVLKYDDNLDVYQANDVAVNWDMTIGDKEISLSPGEYTFLVRYGSQSYQNGNRVWNYTNKIKIGPFLLEKGKTYVLRAFVIGNQVQFNLNEEKAFRY